MKLLHAIRARKATWPLTLWMVGAPPDDELRTRVGSGGAGEIRLAVCRMRPSAQPLTSRACSCFRAWPKGSADPSQRRRLAGARS